MSVPNGLDNPDKTTVTGRMPHRDRRGSSTGPWLIGISLFVLVGAIFLLVMPPPDHNSQSNKPLRLYCAAGLKPALDEALQSYRAETNTPIEVQYGGSGTLLSQLEVRPQAVDMFLPADDSYLQTARSKGLIRESWKLAHLTPVALVAKGNPCGIDSLDSLVGENVRLGLANPDTAAIGFVTRSVLSQSQRWAELKAKCKVFKPTVNEIANDVALGSIDAAIVWDSTATMFRELEPIELPEFEDSTRCVSIAVTAATPNSAEALRFIRYLNSSESGQPIFEKHGFQTVGTVQTIQ